jgi:hypothetical protein
VTVTVPDGEYVYTSPAARPRDRPASRTAPGPGRTKPETHDRQPSLGSGAQLRLLPGCRPADRAPASLRLRRRASHSGSVTGPAAAAARPAEAAARPESEPASEPLRLTRTRSPTRPPASESLARRRASEPPDAASSPSSTPPPAAKRPSASASSSSESFADPARPAARHLPSPKANRARPCGARP